jgi:hypothetical protein
LTNRWKHRPERTGVERVGSADSRSRPGMRCSFLVIRHEPLGALLHRRTSR